MKVIINGLYQKNFVHDNWAILGPQKAHLIGSKNFFKILKNERSQWIHENFISCSLRKKFIWDNLIFLAFRPFFTV